eukprot:tig00020723_g13525.t1
MGNAKSSRCYTLPIAPVKHDPLQPPKGPCDSAELVTSDNVKEGILSPGQADGFTKSKINAGNLEDAKAYYEEWCKSAGGTHIQFNGGDECLSLGYAMEYAGGPRESRKASLAIQNKTADGEPLKSGTCYDIYSSGNIRDYKAPGEFIGDNRVREAFADYVSSHLDETAGAVDLAALEVRAGAGPELELEDETAIDAVQAELAADAEAALLADA